MTEKLDVSSRVTNMFFAAFTYYQEDFSDQPDPREL